jgi:hypothetical protein
VSGQVIVVALLVEGTAAAVPGKDPGKFVLIQIHPTVVFLILLVVIIVPAGLADGRIHGNTSPLFWLSYHNFKKKEILAVEIFEKT